MPRRSISGPPFLLQVLLTTVEWRATKKRWPDPKTSADFRKHTLAPLRQVCRAFTVLGTPRHRYAGARIASDGRKGTAVHTKAHPFPPDTRPKLLAPIDQRSEGARQALDGQATQEEAGTPSGAVADHGQAKLEALPQCQLRSAAGPAP